ncbi:methyltransferase type 11 [Parafrankia soli]|uniref:Methyltransferase type 11 n=1 Tax=Parafrankia soli TaxID=2599596 RepID=A0A1S1RCU4_9ACTN|nr:class I SAM-dependent methyltransferase [Parafrankia soli]OHV43072.1 methyltransferase type 11 [Parafrankia soli]
MDGLTMDGLTVDGVAMSAITMGGFTIEEITVERILPRGHRGRDNAPIEILIRDGGVEIYPPSAENTYFAPRTERDRPAVPAARESTEYETAYYEPARFEPAEHQLTQLELAEHEPADYAPVEHGSAGPEVAEYEPADETDEAGDPAEQVDQAHPATVFDRAAYDYDADVHGVPFFRPLGKTLVAAAGISPGENVIDLACGRGAVLFPAAEATGPAGSVRAFDLAPTMVELTAADVAARQLPWVDVTIADAMDPPVEPGSVDVVLCGMGLFLLPDPVAALARWRGVLRPGGRLAVTVFGPADPLWDRPDYPLRLATSVGAAERRPGHAILAEGALADALTATGFTLTRDELVATDLVFRDVAHWWRWAWGTALRSMLEKVSDAEGPAMIEELTRWHAPSTDAGGLHWRPTIRVVTAVVTDPSA